MHKQKKGQAKQMKMGKFREKMDGVYNFDSAADCQVMIEMLLRDNGEANKKLEDVKTQLKLLALLVVNNKPNASEKAHDVINGMQKRSKADVWSFIVDMSTEANKAAALDNKEIIGAVFDLVWGDLPMNSRESAVLEELIHRFKDSVKIEDEITEKVS